MSIVWLRGGDRMSRNSKKESNVSVYSFVLRKLGIIRRSGS